MKMVIILYMKKIFFKASKHVVLVVLAALRIIKQFKMSKPTNLIKKKKTERYKIIHSITSAAGYLITLQ